MRRMTIVYRDGTAVNQWDDVTDAGRFRYVSNLAELVQSAAAMGNRLERIVVDAAIDPHLFAEMIRSLRKSVDAEAVLLRDGKAYVGSPTPEERYHFYQLDGRDTVMYLKTHGLHAAPAARPEPATLPLAAVLPPFGASDTSRSELVLVADDDRKAREHVSDTLRALGFSVVLAGTGVQAIRLAESLRPPYIVLDGLMPEMHGFEVARFIRASAKGYSPRILMMTAIYKQSRYQNDAMLKYGVDGYLIKPATAALLSSSLRPAVAA
ncbi:MAG TPA: response regulator [Thermoanaerobaculia bacterium]|nr:response regulator [Thermoanaerobaculia bacterium]